MGAATSAVLATAIAAGIATAGGEPPSPAISGDAVVGSTLSASPGDVFKWQRCDPQPDSCGEGIGDSGWSDIDGAAGNGASAYVLAEADLGHLIRVLAKGAPRGTPFAASEPVGPVRESDAPAEPEPEAVVAGESQPPVFQRTGNVEPTAGTVLVRLPDGTAHPITALTQIPVGSTVDVSNGRAVLTTQRRPGGRLQSTEEWGAAFVFDQKRRGTITQLTITEPLVAARSAVSARRGRGGGLWGRGRCRCRTHGQNSSGTARGTWYLVKDTKRGTRTRVKHGKVLVKEFATGERVLLRAGESHLARAPR